MDMRASPYDLSEWGYPAIRIETPDGKAEYVEYQRAFSAESQELRRRLLRELTPLLLTLGTEALGAGALRPHESPEGKQ
jgi:hypothetical protein